MIGKLNNSFPFFTLPAPVFTIRQIFILSFLLFPLWGLAQFTLTVNPVDQAEVPDVVEYKRTFPSTIARQSQLKKLVVELQNIGYLTASIDSMQDDSLSLKTY